MPGRIAVVRHLPRIGRHLLLRAGLLILAGLFGLVGLILELGQRLSPEVPGVGLLFGLAMVCFLAELVLAARDAPTWIFFLKRRWPAVTLTALLLIQVLVLAFAGDADWLRLLSERTRLRSLTQVFLVVTQVYVTALLVISLPRLHARFAALKIRPGLAFLLIFLAAILVGGGLLCLPGATPPDHPITFLDAAFTATSAVCVTGLAVRDTGTQFTFLGQAVILLLIQLGGLGIMSLGAALAYFLGQGVGIREGSAMRELFQVPGVEQVAKLLRFIVGWTFAAEAIGATVLFFAMAPLVPGAGPRLFAAVFHSVSAFCNAGFGLFPRNLEGPAATAPILGTVAALIIVGGLGFTVALNLLVWARSRWRRRIWRQRRPVRLTIQTRVMLIGTFILLAGGTLGLSVLEWNGILAGLPPWSRIGHAFFQSVVCRTAGFNSLPIGAFGAPALFLMIILMFIGAGSGSTAGGVKITTLAVLWGDLRAIAAGRNQIRLFDREIGILTEQQATVVLLSGGAFGALGTFALLITDGRELLASVFEVVSALGTVGLSTGITPSLTPAGKFVLIVLMYVGRVGILTFAYGLVGPRRDRDVRMPTGDLMVG
jgi:trk system potassium uptake protein